MPDSLRPDNLRITLAQTNPLVGDIDGNRRLVLRLWEEHDKTADLLVFSEMVLTGYPPEDMIVKPAFLDTADAAIADIVERSRNFSAAILLPAPRREGARVHNAALLIERGKILGTVFKHDLANYGVFDEMRVFAPGPLPEPLEFLGHKLGVMICEDMWHADVALHLKKQGADILIVPNASPFETAKHESRLLQARTRTQETGLTLVYVNQWGGQDDLVFDGRSFVMDARGNVLLQMDAFRDHAAVIPTEADTHAPAYPEEQLIYKALVTGLRDYVRKNGFGGIVLGLSGGIDSAMAAIIAADAIGPPNVRCVMLPSQFTSQDSLDDAAQLAKNIGVALETIPIEPAVAALRETIASHVKNAPDVTWENLQSRARGIILMALSNATGALLLSTGNKSEMATGYATLYGDMCGGFNPLKDLYKTEVYRLARWRNDNGLIPERILTKAPTAELKAGQTDQDTLPPYDVLDAILQGLIERDLSIDAIAADLSAEARRAKVEGHDRAVVARVARMLDRAEYKRRQAPPGPKITRRTLDRDRRWPMTNGFKDGY